MALCAAACTNAMIASAQRKMAAGRYEEAHQELVGLLSSPGKLSASDRRVAQDDLCLSEYRIGAPAYSLDQQRRDCAFAAREPGSAADPVLAKINHELASRERERIEISLRRDDLPAAVAALIRYQQVDGTDRRHISRWKAEIWRLVERSDQAQTPRYRARRARAVRLIRAEYPNFKSMSRRSFIRWVEREGGEGEPAEELRRVRISGHTLDLTIAAGELRQAELGPPTFGRINDAFSAWCRCYGDTHVISEETGMPIYLSRINGWTMRSEVLALPWH